MSKKLVAALDRTYASLPVLDCKGLCQDSCTGPIPVSHPERNRVMKAGGQLPVARKLCDNLVEGACSVYRVRPLICRLWGTVENMACPHGCVPKGGHLTREQGGRVVAQVVRIAGEAS